MKAIKQNTACGIEYTLDLGGQQIVVRTNGKGGGTIESKNLHENCESAEDAAEAVANFNGMIDGIESLLLACACEGVSIDDPKFLRAVRTALDACGNEA
jgi:hypothetical protein